MEIQPLTASVGVSPSSSAPREKPTLSSPPIPAPKLEELQQSVEAIRLSVVNSTTNLRFSVDDSSGRTVVSVVDAETMEVVRQIPSEEVMEIAKALDRMQGLLINRKA